MYGGVFDKFQARGAADSNASKVNVFVLLCEDRLVFDSCRWCCCINTTYGFLVATVGSALFGGCVGGLFNFELAILALMMVLALVCHVSAKNLTWLLAIWKHHPWLVVSQLAQNDRACLVTLVMSNSLTLAWAKIILSFRLALESLCDIWWGQHCPRMRQQFPGSPKSLSLGHILV